MNQQTLTRSNTWISAALNVFSYSLSSHIVDFTSTNSQNMQQNHTFITFKRFLTQCLCLSSECGKNEEKRMKGKTRRSERRRHATRSQVGFGSTTSGKHGCRVGNQPPATGRTLATGVCDWQVCLAGDRPSFHRSEFDSGLSCTIGRQNEEGSE